MMRVKTEVQVDRQAAASLIDRVRSAAEAHAKLMAERARELVPVWTGGLRDSIAGWVADEDSPTAVVGASAAHAAFVELGTSDTEPQPYLRPAMDDPLLAAEAARRSRAMQAGSTAVNGE